MGKFIDLTGQRFGRLVVVKRAENDKRGSARFECLCDCGTIKVVYAASLKKGMTKSCGCLQKQRCRESNTRDISGIRFGYLVAIKPCDSTTKKYLCLCDCGAQTIVYRNNLLKGNTRSCGCLWTRNIVNRVGFNKGTHTVIHLDGNRSNIDTNNLVIVTKKVRNRIMKDGYRASTTDPNVLKTEILNAELRTMINSLEHPDKKGDTP